MSTKPTASIEDIYPLSPIQQGVLFQSLYAPNSGVYVVQVVYEIRGTLDVSAFVRAWQTVISHHSVLRTDFEWEEVNDPVQIVYRHIDVPFMVLDWRTLSEAEQDRQLDTFLDEDRKRGFDLASAPLMRLTLIRTNEAIYRFIWSHHLLIADGWSVALVIKDVFQVYADYCQGLDVQPSSALPYRSYIAWLLEQDLTKAEAYWRKSLKNFVAPTPLPKSLRSSVKEDSQEQYRVEASTVSEATVERLQAFSRKYHLTLNTLVQGAWTLLLSHYSGETDVVFGVTVSGRPVNLFGAEAIVGPFINTLPFRVQVRLQSTVIPWLQEIQSTQVEMRQYEHSPLLLVQKWSDIPRDRSVFESVFVFENYPVDRGESSHLTVRKIQTQEKNNYPLTLLVGTGEGLSLRISYNIAQFDTSTIARILGHLQTLLESIVTNPDQVIGSLSFLTLDERSQILDWGKGRTTHHPLNNTLHNLFQTQVIRDSTSIAAYFNGQQISYGELERRSNQVAHHLLALGVAPETPIGLCINRSIDMLIAILGILKARACVLPLDPAYPVARLRFIIAEARPQIIVSLQALADLLRDSPVPVVYLDSDQNITSRYPETQITLPTLPDSLAYVLYTSGSTGNPKGVMMTHRAILNSLYWLWDEYPFAPDETCCQKTLFSFGDGIQEIFGALLKGVPLLICPDAILKDPYLLVEALAAHEVTRITLVPSLLRLLLDDFPDLQQRLPRLKLWLVSGEAMPVELARDFTTQMPTSLAVNLYGATETTCDATWYEVRETLEPFASTPIGTALSNSHVYILDRFMQLVPIGMPGELYVGGLAVARGYMNRSDLTADRFVANPFSQEPGTRLYRTGDVAYFMTDGNIAFVGRKDRQVKIRGFRIELAEVETTLKQHYLVVDAIVIGRKDTAGELQLMAYIVSGGSRSLAVSELRSFLLERLPAQFVPAPANFVFMKSFPLTPSGKVDVLALPEPAQRRSNSEEGFVPPRNPVEEAVAELWATLLKVEPISIYANFFELGGHSLLAMQLISRVRTFFQVELPLRSLFENPTIAGQAEVVTQIRAVQHPVSPAIKPIPRSGTLPLSFSQQRQWILDQLLPDTPIYNVPFALRIHGHIEVIVLKRILSEIVRRHEILRTTFNSIDGEPTQIINPPYEPDLSVTDLEQVVESARDALAHDLIDQEIHRPFNLMQGPLFRTRLLRLRDREFTLILTMSHIITDGWSLHVLFRELVALGEAFIAGKPSPLVELPVQYADFAIWQRNWLVDAVLEDQLAYWKQQLSNLPILDLPTDRPRMASTSVRGAAETLDLPEYLRLDLKRVSQEEGVTLFMIFLAAFKILLYRYTRQEDIVVGTPIAGRHSAEIEALIGFFVNTLVLRTNLSDNPTLRETLHRVREVALDAYTHQDLPFEKLVEDLQPERDLYRNPLFQVIVQLQNIQQMLQPIEGLDWEPIKIERATTHLEDLSVNITEQPGHIRVLLEYNADLFEASTIKRMLEHYKLLLEAITNDLDCPISELRLLSHANQQLLQTWNSTSKDYGQDRFVHTLFEAQVERSPSATALIFENRSLTYVELNHRANQLAHYLRAHGIKPDMCVGICMERSLEMVVALLGILKAGGAFVPIDPNYPVERMNYIFQDADVHIILTQENLRARLSNHPLHIVWADAECDALAQQPDTNLPQVITPDNLAYVIYTSGSTGKPKGVMNVHQGITNRLCWMQDTFPMDKTDHVLQKTPFSFDVSLWEFFAPLIAGACLVIARPDGHRDPAYLVDTIEQQHITIIHFVPSMLRIFLNSPDLQRCTALRWVSCSGEALAFDLQELFFEHFPGVALYNLYGPTEAAIEVSYWRCQPDDPRHLVPIGRPISNTQLHVLDVLLQPVPVGVPGELYIGGINVARGYLNRPDLTSECFVADPFAIRPGARFYKTGDLARWLPDGVLEYRGRLDNQIKLRGFRIELGEIEAILVQHPAIYDAAVVAHGIEEHMTLVAYIVSDDLTPNTLRAFLANKLPDHMIPSFFVPLKAFPLTDSGKIDRVRLQTYPLPRAESERSMIDSPVEEVIAEIWADILDLEHVEANDDFFKLGGHSLLAVKVIYRLNASLGVNLPLRSLFEAPVVSELAKIVELKRSEQSQPGAAITPKPQHILPLASISQERIWRFDQMFPNSALFNIPNVVRFNGPLDISILLESLHEIIRRHETLRTTFRIIDEQVVQIIAPEITTPFVAYDFRNMPAAEQEETTIELASAEPQRPFDLAEGPLFRVILLRVEENDYIMFLTVHHIISDGWSVEILIREWMKLYEAFSKGQSSPLPDLPLQYADFAYWQYQRLTDHSLDAQIDYWQERLSPSPVPLRLPFQHARPQMYSLETQSISLRLSPEATGTLRALSRREGVTLFMSVLTAFKVLLYAYTLQEDILVGTLIANRHLPELDKLIGLFINTLLLRTRISPQASFIEHMNRVRETVLSAYEHQDVPFEIIMEKWKQAQGSKTASLVQVLFLWQYALPQVQLPSDLKMIALEKRAATTDPHLTATTFDIILLVEDRQDDLYCTLTYQTALFDHPMIEQMLLHFVEVIETMSAQPEQSLSTLTESIHIQEENADRGQD